MVKIRSLRSLLFHSSNRQHRRGWAASLAVISIGAIAITLFSGFLANAASLQNRIDSMISGSNAPEIYLTTDPRDGYDVKEADKLVANVDGIAAAVSNSVYGSLAGTPPAVLAIMGDFSAIKWGMVRDPKAEVIEFGDPDGQGDLKRYNQIAYRVESVFAYAVLDADAFAVLS